MIIKIAVTGGIASGKTTFCTLLSKELNSYYYNCDILVAEIYNDFNFCLENFANHEFFSNILNSDGIVDKVKLKQIIVETHSALMDISKIVWSKIKEKILLIISDQSNEFVLFEIPLLFESGFDSMFDYIINIESDINVRIKRRNLSAIDKKFFDIFINHQCSNDFRKIHSDLTIHNNGSVRYLKKEIKKLMIILKKEIFK